MVRYFFHVSNGNGFVTDEEGQEIADEASAREEAIKSVRSIISDEASSGVIDLTGHIEVVDANGERVLVVAFEDAFQVKLREAGKA